MGFFATGFEGRGSSRNPILVNADLRQKFGNEGLYSPRPIYETRLTSPPLHSFSSLGPHVTHVWSGHLVCGNAPQSRFPRARRAGQTWAAWGPSGGTAETGKKNGIGGPPGSSKCRGPPEAAAPRANRDWEASRPDVGGMGSQWRHRRNREKKRYRRAPRCQQMPGAPGNG
jgi:hypothetical protein